MEPTRRMPHAPETNTGKQNQSVSIYTKICVCVYQNRVYNYVCVHIYGTRTGKTSTFGYVYGTKTGKTSMCVYIHEDICVCISIRNQNRKDVNVGRYLYVTHAANI